MAINDPIADMLTRIRNANMVHHRHVMVKNSKVCRGIAQVLKDEGYITDFDVVEDGRQGMIRIELKYGKRGETVITQITRESKPGCRVYKKVEELPRPLAGMGIAIVSTSRGVVSDKTCRENRIGGELLATVM